MNNERAGEELMATLAAVRRVVRRQLRSFLPGPYPDGAHPGPSQVELLRYVEDNPGTGVAAAARALYLAGNSVSTQVNQLVEAGLLRREPDPADRRAARLGLTDAARTHLNGYRTIRGQLVGAALKRLPDADRAALDAALPALRRLLSELKENQ